MLEEEGLSTSHTGAKSYVSADAGLVERIRGELVEETVRGAAAALRQMGVDRDEAAALLRRLWDAGKRGEEAR